MSHWHPGYVYAIHGRLNESDKHLTRITDWVRNRESLYPKLTQLRSNDNADGIAWGDYEIKMISADWLA